MSETFRQGDQPESSQASTRLGVALVLLLGAVGIWLRLPGFQLGILSDELANIQPGSFGAILWDAESGVNPPLLRLLVNLTGPEPQTLWRGRMLALLCSLLTMVGAWRLGRLAGQGMWGGLTAVALWAFHPVAVQYATIFRSYGLWGCVLTWHLLGVAMAVRAEKAGIRRRWTVIAVATGIVLPWIHYFSVPVLLGVGASLFLWFPAERRRLFLVYPAAALGLAPMYRLMLFEEGRRVVHSEPVLQSVQKIVGIGLRPPEPVRKHLMNLLPMLEGTSLGWQSWMALSVVGFCGWAWWTGRRRPEVVLAAGAGLGVASGVLFFAQVQAVRGPVQLMVLAALVPVVAAVPSLVSRPGWRGPMAVAVAVWFGASIPEELARMQSQQQERQAVPEVVGRLDELIPAGVVRVYPSYIVGDLFWHQAHLAFSRSRSVPPCAAGDHCFEAEGRVWWGLERPEDVRDVRGLLVDFDRQPPSLFLQRCQLGYEGDGFRVFRCGDGPTAQGPGTESTAH